MAHDEDQTTPALHSDGPSAPQGLGPGARVGPWRLTSMLGSGGMGEVWAAERADGAFEQRAAVKLVRADRGAEAIVGRFLAERQILASLDHPHIARLLDGGLAPDGRPYFALELVEGSPVTDWARLTQPSLDELLGRVLDLCDAVEAAHQRLVVHRDIKPGNVLVTADGRLKLLDFGIAKVIEADVDTRETQLGGRPCTPAYAAPEQLLGEPVTTATDVYLIGALTFELLTGRPPFERDPAALPRLLESLRTEEPPPPSRVAAAAPTLPGPRWAGRLRGDLDTVVTRALQADPARRYRTVAALADDLRRFLEGRPVTARPSTLAYRAKKLVLRHRASAAAAAAAVVALCAGTGLALWQAAEARRAERLARDHERRAERMKDFVLSVFREQDPLLRSSARARPAADVVREGLERARSELGGEPDLQADLLSDLGAVQGDLGDLDSASAALEQALARRAGTLAARDKRLAETRLSLSFVRVAQGRLDEAAELAEQTRSALAGEPGVAALLARAESHLGRIALLRGDARRSLQLSRQAYERAAAALGPEDPEAAFYLVHVGIAAEAVGDLDQGVRSLEEAVARLEHRLGPSHVRLVVPLTALGDVLAAAQRLDDAERAYRRALAIAEAQLGPGHRQVGALLKRMASVLSDHGQHAQALEHSERARSVPWRRWAAWSWATPSTCTAACSWRWGARPPPRSPSPRPLRPSTSPWAPTRPTRWARGSGADALRWLPGRSRTGCEAWRRRTRGSRASAARAAPTPSRPPSGTEPRCARPAARPRPSASCPLPSRRLAIRSRSRSPNWSDCCASGPWSAGGGATCPGPSGTSA